MQTSPVTTLHIPSTHLPSGPTHTTLVSHTRKFNSVSEHHVSVSVEVLMSVSVTGQVVSGYRIRAGKWSLIGRQSPQLPQVRPHVRSQLGKSSRLHVGHKVSMSLVRVWLGTLFCALYLSLSTLPVSFFTINKGEKFSQKSISILLC